MLNTHLRIVQFKARNFCNCLIQVISKFQRHNVQSITPLGRNGDVLNTVVHKNIRISNVIVYDILDSDHLPIVFHSLDHVRINKVPKPFEKFTDLERFQCLTSNLISPRIRINSGILVNKAERDFTAPIASTYQLSKSMITLSELNNDLPGLDCLLKDEKTVAGNQGS
jgi:hypothetical protein